MKLTHPSFRTIVPERSDGTVDPEFITPAGATSHMDGGYGFRVRAGACHRAGPSGPDPLGAPRNDRSRRAFIALLGGAATLLLFRPLAARAQPAERMRRIGVLMNQVAGDPIAQARFHAFALGLGQLGWTEGRNVALDVRWGAPDAERFRRDAAELVALKPDVILAASGATMPAIVQAPPAPSRSCSC